MQPPTKLNICLQLYETAQSHRLPDQGNVTYHQFSSKGYKHVDIVIDPDIPKIIE